MNEEHMYKGCNPVRNKGERNVFCFNYGKCLDLVIDSGWEDWDCRQCMHRENNWGAPEIELYINHSIPFYEIS